ncbi:Uu.00g136280.m01.CDS01 [Anthostomella pinea]|uniref:Uu.00g136280.m01.CDS01 n=1 Tax=Anthostomella pinea TaxID=933095 RepID=A0AAI8VPA4_9PEZI|nr:Uu.00g136280.m01.CDS01 [Anthostomella pinea]
MEMLGNRRRRASLESGDESNRASKRQNCGRHFATLADRVSGLEQNIRDNSVSTINDMQEIRNIQDHYHEEMRVLKSRNATLQTWFFDLEDKVEALEKARERTASPPPVKVQNHNHIHFDFPSQLSLELIPHTIYSAVYEDLAERARRPKLEQTRDFWLFEGNDNCPDYYVRTGGASLSRIAPAPDDGINIEYAAAHPNPYQASLQALVADDMPYPIMKMDYRTLNYQTYVAEDQEGFFVELDEVYEKEGCLQPRVSSTYFHLFVRVDDASHALWAIRLKPHMPINRPRSDCTSLLQSFAGGVWDGSPKFRRADPPELEHAVANPA